MKKHKRIGALNQQKKRRAGPMQYLTEIAEATTSTHLSTTLQDLKISLPIKLKRMLYSY